MNLQETVGAARAKASIEHLRNGVVLSYEERSNLITNAGIDFLHAQGYGTAGVANGLNWMALSDDAVSEDADSTVLSAEITDFGLARAQSSVSHSAGENVTKLTCVFVATDTVKCQKMAMFSDSAGGTMNHVIGFSERSLLAGDTLQVTVVVKIG